MADSVKPAVHPAAAQSAIAGSEHETVGSPGSVNGRGGI